MLVKDGVPALTLTSNSERWDAGRYLLPICINVHKSDHPADGLRRVNG